MTTNSAAVKDWDRHLGRVEIERNRLRLLRANMTGNTPNFCRVMELLREQGQYSEKTQTSQILIGLEKTWRMRTYWESDRCLQMRRGGTKPPIVCR